MATVRPSHPVLLFDSGLGGLSVLDKFRSIAPHVPLVYVADHAALPYGEKSEAEIASRVPALLGRLAERYGPSLITIACNTASTIALDGVRSALDIPIVGTVPALKPAAEQSKTRTIGLLGTAATIRQPYVDRLHERFGADCTLIRHAAGPLVLAAEAQLQGKPVDEAVFDDAIAGLVKQPSGESIDTIVLACTHFPIVVDALELAWQRQSQVEDRRFVDGAQGIARRMLHLLGDDTRSRDSENGNLFVTTGPQSKIDELHSALASYGFTTFETF